METDLEGKPEQPVCDRLALIRTRLANERTMLAYLRTAIMLAVAGATLFKFFGDSSASVVSGWLLIAGAIGVGTYGAVRFQKLSRNLE